jgi:hypothetical protein
MGDGCRFVVFARIRLISGELSDDPKRRQCGISLRHVMVDMVCVEDTSLCGVLYSATKDTVVFARLFCVGCCLSRLQVVIH